MYSTGLPYTLPPLLSNLTLVFRGVRREAEAVGGLDWNSWVKKVQWFGSLERRQPLIKAWEACPVLLLPFLHTCTARIKQQVLFLRANPTADPFGMSASVSIRMT